MLLFSVCLVSLSMTVSGFIHVAANGIFASFLVAGQHSLLYVSPLFLVHSCVGGHYGCFPVVSRAAVIFVVPVSFSIRLFSLDEPLYISPTGGLQDQKLSLSLGLDGPSVLFSAVAVTDLLLPAEVQEGSLFFRCSLGFIVCSQFDDALRVVFELISLYPFDLQFSRDEPWRGVFYLMEFFFSPHVQGL